MQETLDQMAKRYETTVLGLALMVIKFTCKDSNEITLSVSKDFTLEEARIIEQSAPGSMRLATRLYAASVQNGRWRI